MVEKRFPILRILAVLFKIAGVLVGVFAVIGALGACLAGTLTGGMMGGFGNGFGFGDASVGVLGGLLLGLNVLLVGGFFALALLASGEQIDVLIALEENTRVVRMMMEEQKRAAQPLSAPPAQGFTPSITPRPVPTTPPTITPPSPTP